MTREVKGVLFKWHKSINRFGKLDQWSINKDFNVLATFIRHSSDRQLRYAIINCRDTALSMNFNRLRILTCIDNVMRLIRKADNITDNNALEYEMSSVSQSDRYFNITKVIGKEKIKSCGNRYLRNLDINILDGKDAKLVKRIVEKRMCQEYHKQHKNSFHLNGNKSRHQMKRAVSYQLFNIGQIEGSDIHREKYTHWKWKYDVSLKEYVLKKKVAYNTIEEAQQALLNYCAKHINEKDSVDIYLCKHCNKYHIGHFYKLEDNIIA